MITELFEDWKRVFGAKLQERQVLDIRTTELWAIALKALRITPAEFSTALAKSLTLKWPPTVPADFLELARAGKQSEYLDTQTAFETACRCAGMRGDVERNWRHPTVLEAANRIGWENLAAAGNGFIKYFATVYEQVVSEHQAGANFVIQQARRIEHKNIPASAEFVDELLCKHGFKKGGKGKQSEPCEQATVEI